MNEFEKQELKRKIGIGCIAAGVVVLVIAEKRRVDRLIQMSQAAVYETMEGSFDEGVKYGIKIAKESGLLPTSMKELYELGRPLNQGTLS